MFLKEILSSVESTASETDELLEMDIQKLSEEHSHDISQKETIEQKLVDEQDSKEDAHCRAFLNMLS